MIIIKTKNGAVLVNDKEIITLRHDIEKHTATIIRNGGPMFNRGEPITQVESIIFTNDATKTEWKDDGSEVKCLKESVKNYKLELSCLKEIIGELEYRLRNLGHNCVQWVQYYHEKMPKELCEQMRNQGEEAKKYVNDGESWMYRRQFMETHKTQEDLDVNEMARLNAQVEQLEKENRHLNGNYENRIQECEHLKSVIHDLENRSLWQVIKESFFMK